MQIKIKSTTASIYAVDKDDQRAVDSDTKKGKEM